MNRFIPALGGLLYLFGSSQAHAQFNRYTVEVTAPLDIAGEYTPGTASFGPNLVDVGPIAEEVVLAFDSLGASTTDGCEPIFTPLVGKIALVDRGECPFVLKVQNAQAAGAIAVIVANNVGGDVVTTMGGTDPGAVIPSVMISQNLGISFKARLPGVMVILRGERDKPVINFPADCTAGMADLFACEGVDLLGHVHHSLFLSPGSDAPTGGNDIWGWTDPLTLNEYALVGLTNGTAFVDVTNPTTPIYLGKLPAETFESAWRDIKTYGDYAFIVADGAGSHGMQVFDLTRLRSVASPPETFTTDALYTDIGSAHNIVINEDSGFAYAVGSGTCAGGLHMIDISNPLVPTPAGCFSADGYTHDAQCVNYSGPDTDYAGSEICVALNEDTVTIVEVTNKVAPVQVARVAYPNAFYTHQGWFSEDQRYFIVDDELDELNIGGLTKTFVFDMLDLDSPDFVFIHEGTTDAVDHNLYVHEGKVFQSNYAAGLRILDASDLGSGLMPEIASFDTYPVDDFTSFNGQWSNYPFFPSGLIVANDRQYGLFALRFSSPPSFSITLKPRNPPIVIPAEGGSFEFKLKLRNETAGTLDQDIWTVVTFPDGSLEVNNNPLHLELAPDGKKNRRFLVEIEEDAMPGVYTITGNVGVHPDDVTGSSSFTFEKLDVPFTASGQRAQLAVPGGVSLMPFAEGWLDDKLDGSESTAEAPTQSAIGLPEVFALHAAYPNPFNPTATLRFDLPEAAAARLVVYDAVGREVATLVDGRLQAGRHEVSFNLSNLPSGVYLARFTAGLSFTQTQRMTLLK